MLGSLRSPNHSIYNGGKVIPQIKALNLVQNRSEMLGSWRQQWFISVWYWPRKLNAFRITQKQNTWENYRYGYPYQCRSMPKILVASLQSSHLVSLWYIFFHLLSSRNINSYSYITQFSLYTYITYLRNLARNAVAGEVLTVQLTLYNQSDTCVYVKELWCLLRLLDNL